METLWCSFYMIYSRAYIYTFFSQFVMEDKLLLSRVTCSKCGLKSIPSSFFQLSGSIWSVLKYSTGNNHSDSDNKDDDGKQHQ